MASSTGNFKNFLKQITSSYNKENLNSIYKKKASGFGPMQRNPFNNPPNQRKQPFVMSSPAQKIQFSKRLSMKALDDDDEPDEIVTITVTQ